MHLEGARDGIIDSVDMSLSKLREIVKDRGAWQATVHRVTKESDTTEQLILAKKLSYDGPLSCCFQPIFAV